MGHISYTIINILSFSVPESSVLTKNYFEDSLENLERRLHRVVRPVGKSNLDTETSVPKDCSEVDVEESGVYVIKPLNSEKSFAVYCDMKTEGGGWTVSFLTLLYILKISK